VSGIGMESIFKGLKTISCCQMWHEAASREETATGIIRDKHRSVKETDTVPLRDLAMYKSKK